MDLPTRTGSSSQMVNLELGACFMRSAKQAAHASRSVALSAARLAKVMSPTRLHQFEALHKIYFYDAWRNEPILDREPAAPAQRCYNRCFGCHATFGHWHACYQLWSPNDLDLISSDGQLSLLPSPDSAHGTGFCSPCERQPCFVRTNNLRRLTFRHCSARQRAGPPQGVWLGGCEKGSSLLRFRLPISIDQSHTV